MASSLIITAKNFFTTQESILWQRPQQLAKWGAIIVSHSVARSARSLLWRVTTTPTTIAETSLHSALSIKARNY
jgi:hypothetical protein